MVDIILEDCADHKLSFGYEPKAGMILTYIVKDCPGLGENKIHTLFILEKDIHSLIRILGVTEIKKEEQDDKAKSSTDYQEEGAHPVCERQ